jgi:hypothetical protein
MSMITISELRSNPERFVRLRLAALRSPTAFRFGGNSPKGIYPLRRTEFTSYLLTLPFESSLSCSIFVNLTSMEPSSPHFVFSAAGIAHDDCSPFVEALWHPPIVEIDTIQLPIQFPQLAFELEGQGCDPMPPSDPERCFDHHKLGGYPYFYQAGEGVIEVSRQLTADGFHHHFQLSFPGPYDAEVDCNWPFGEYVFHVFARPCEGRFELRFVWS